MSHPESFKELFSGVRERVIESIPDAARQLLADIEYYSGTEIEFRTKSRFQELGGTFAIQDAAYCDETRAHITINDDHGIDAMAVTHELLHIYRYWVEQIPVLDTVSEQDVELFAGIDNALEHLSIVPRQQHLGFDTTPYWTQQMRQVFGRSYHKTPQGNAKRLLLLGWTMTAFCKDQHARRAALSTLQQYDLQRNARLLLEGLQKSKTKSQMTKLALSVLDIPTSSARLITMDVRNNRRVESKILP